MATKTETTTDGGKYKVGQTIDYKGRQVVIQGVSKDNKVVLYDPSDASRIISDEFVVGASGQYKGQIFGRYGEVDLSKIPEGVAHTLPPTEGGEQPAGTLPEGITGLAPNVGWVVTKGGTTEYNPQAYAQIKGTTLGALGISGYKIPTVAELEAKYGKWMTPETREFIASGKLPPDYEKLPPKQQFDLAKQAGLIPEQEAYEDWERELSKTYTPEEKAEIESGRYMVYDPTSDKFVPSTKAMVEERDRLGYTPEELREIASGKFVVYDYKNDDFVPVTQKQYEEREKFYQDTGLTVDQVKEINSERYKIYDYDTDKFVPVTKDAYEKREQFYQEFPMIAPPGTPNSMTPQELESFLVKVADYRKEDPDTGDVTYDIAGIINDEVVPEKQLKLVFNREGKDVVEEVKEVMRSGLGVEGIASAEINKYWDLRTGEIIDAATRQQILEQDANAPIVKFQPALVLAADPYWQELKDRPKDDPERQQYLQQWQQKVIDTAAFVGTVAMPYTWGATGWVGGKIATGLGSLAAKVALIGSKPLLAIPRVAPVASLIPGMVGRGVSLIPKLATSLAQLTLTGAPAVYASARVKDELFPISLEQKYDLFKTLSEDDKNRLSRLSGYEDRKYEELNDAEKAVVLLNYAPPAGFTLTEWSKAIQGSSDKLREYAAQGADWVRERAPIASEPFVFAGNTVAGVVEGLGYAANMPVVAANLSDKIPRGSAKDFAQNVAIGMATFFSKEIPEAIKIDPTAGMGRMVGLFLFTPASLLKFAKGVGYDIPVSAVKGMSNIAVSFNPLFIKPMMNLTPKDVRLIIDSIKMKGGITKPLVGSESLIQDFLRNAEGVSSGQVRSKINKLINDVLLTEGKQLLDHERIQLADEIMSKVWSSTTKPEFMMRMAADLVKQMTTQGVENAKTRVGDWIVEVRKPAYQQVVGDTYFVFGDKSRFPEDAPIKPTETPYGRPGEGMAMAPTGVERFGVMTGLGQKVENPTIAMLHVPKDYMPNQLRAHAGGKAELESWLLENAYPVPNAKSTYVSPITGEVYPVLHYVIRGAEYKGLSPKQVTEINVVAAKEAFLDALLGWYGRQKTLEAKFGDTITPKINDSIKSLKQSPDSLIGKNGEVISQIEALHPDRGTMNEKVRALVIHNDRVLLAQDRADPKGVLDLIGGSMNPKEVLIPELGKWNWELPSNQRPTVTWELGARSQVHGELDMLVPKMDYLGMYRGKVGEHAIHGARIFEGKVDSPYFDNVKAWEKYQKDVYNYPNPEIEKAMWWDGQTEITVQPFVYDILRARADKYGWDMSKVKTYEGVRTQNLVRDTNFAERVNRNENLDLTPAQIKQLETKWLGDLKNAYNQRKYGEHASLMDYLTATPDMELLLGVLAGRRRAIQVTRDKVVNSQEAQVLLNEFRGKLAEDSVRVLEKARDTGESIKGAEVEHIKQNIEKELGQEYKTFEGNLRRYEDDLYSELLGEYISKYGDVIANKIAVTAGKVDYGNLDYYPLVEDYIGIPSYPSIYGVYEVPKLGIPSDYPVLSKAEYEGLLKPSGEYPSTIVETGEYPPITPISEPEYPPTTPTGEPEYPPRIPLGEYEYPPLPPPPEIPETPQYPPPEYPPPEYPVTLEKPPPNTIRAKDKEGKERDVRIEPGTVVWIQGRPTAKGGDNAPMYKVILPPYSEETKFTTRETPPGYVDEGWSGKRSAFKSIQVVGGPPSNNVEGIDLGFVRVNINMEAGKPKIDFVHDEDANVGARSLTVGMGEGQIPIKEWEVAKAEGTKYSDFIQQYQAGNIGEKTSVAKEKVEESTGIKQEQSAPLVGITDEMRSEVDSIADEALASGQNTQEDLGWATVNVDVTNKTVNVEYNRNNQAYEEKTGQKPLVPFEKGLVRQRDYLVKDKDMLLPQKTTQRIEKEGVSYTYKDVTRSQGGGNGVREAAISMAMESGEGMGGRRPKKPKNADKVWWESDIYANEPVKYEPVAIGRYYRGRRLLPPNLGGEI